MNKRKLESALKRARIAESKLKSACDDIAEIFQHYFDCDIDVIHQVGDGFVVLYNTDTNGNDSNLNDPVDNVFENLKIDPNHYR